MAEIFLREYRAQIEHTIERGRYVEAVAHGKHILTQYPKHVAPYWLMGKAMLEANQDRYATDMFRRVLGADPENMVAWVGLSEVHKARGELDAAVWYLERAFELDAGNEIVAEELRRLYGQRDGVEPRRVELTRGALARLYLKGGLLSRAISEFRDLLAENPERVDLSVALAEALWRNEQRLEAVAVCQQVLDALPYCLKANLILGEIWTRSGREEGQTYLLRAEALDPENQVAQELFEAASPLPAREVRIVPLEYSPPSEAARPAWMAEIEAVSAEAPSALFDVTGALEAQIEIPAWLEEVVGEEAVAPEPPSPAEAPEPLPPEEAIPVPAEEVPAWLAGLREGFGEEEPEAVAEVEPPDWLAGLDLPPLDVDEVPESLAEPGAELADVTEAPAAPGPREMEALEWLVAPGVEAAAEEAAPPLPPTELPADWLAGIREQLTEEEEAPEEAPTPAPEEAPAPAWLEGEGMPSGDEALAWLEQLAAGKEEELRAQAQAEAEVRMAEIMGRPRPAEPSPAEAAPEEAVAAPLEEAIAPPVEEPFGWTAFGEPEAPPEAIAPPPPARPEPVYAEEVEALPVIEFPVTEAEETLPPEEIPSPEMAPPTEEVHWGAGLDISAEEVIAPPPIVEEVPGVVEMEVSEPAEEAIEEAVAPPEIPSVEAPAEPFAAERAHVKEHPRDYEAWLALAQALWQADERQEALEAYSRVIRAGKLLESVMADLEEYVVQWPDASTQRTLGDAYMRDGRVQEALDIYRRALETL